MKVRESPMNEPASAAQTILAQIEAYKRREIADAKARRPPLALEKRAAEQPPPRGFADAIAVHDPTALTERPRD